jgi:hypothetical protein
VINDKKIVDRIEKMRVSWDAKKVRRLAREARKHVDKLADEGKLSFKMQAWYLDRIDDAEVDAEDRITKGRFSQ